MLPNSNILLQVFLHVQILSSLPCLGMFYCGRTGSLLLFIRQMLASQGGDYNSTFFSLKQLASDGFLRGGPSMYIGLLYRQEVIT